MTTSKHIEPTLGVDSFSCPHCGAISHQTWFRLFLSDPPKNYRPTVITHGKISFPKPNDDDADEKAIKNVREFIARLKKHPVTYFGHGHTEYLESELVNVAVSLCFSCKGFSLWVEDKLFYPVRNSEIIAHEEMPDAIKEDFDEAASIVDKSPRGAAALLRLCIQKLMPELGETGKDLNEDIASLVKKGLEPEIQRALDILRVIGNNAVHPGQIDLKDNKAMAIKLFEMLNLIVERRIATPNKIGSLFEGLPATALEQIENRDKS
jgi:Domain of unknown function (DUF4145)